MLDEVEKDTRLKGVKIQPSVYNISPVSCETSQPSKLYSKSCAAAKYLALHNEPDCFRKPLESDQELKDI